ncbi:glycosyltransferase family 4 protein [Marinibacterium profundimaris]|uniref:glycosyltransferase family 4 protein n=1 Tax=Marinibacterium profundimaris TaxID=1679460 RepID=UPI001E4E795C|nr:glycosyltransferase family 1 protein [Marinibacterium profundimaris]
MDKLSGRHRRRGRVLPDAIGPNAMPAGPIPDAVLNDVTGGAASVEASATAHIPEDAAGRLARLRPAPAARRLTINGKFLQDNLVSNGVHRVALNFAAELERRASATIPTRIVAPAIGEDAGLVRDIGLAPELRPSVLGGGQAWEMLSLPALTRGDLLVNFCNLAPVLHPNSVVMIHDVQTLTVPDAYPKRQVQGYRMLWPAIARRARAILTVSEHSRQALADHGIGTLDKIFVVHNGTDHILRLAPDSDAVTRLGLQGRPFALALGALSSYKNMRTLFRAFQDPALAEVPLVITGRAGRAEYEARGWTPPPNTVFAGRVSDPALRALYEAASVFLFPSETEGFGLPPVEAMQCGTATIAADAGAMPEVCGTGARIIDPLDAEGWAHHVQHLITDTAARAELIAQGRTRAAELTWTHAGDRLWRLLEPML